MNRNVSDTFKREHSVAFQFWIIVNIRISLIVIWFPLLSRTIILLLQTLYISILNWLSIVASGKMNGKMEKKWIEFELKEEQRKKRAMEAVTND